jgi:transcription termination factor NusB
MKNELTPTEIQALKQLKVVRSDNPVYQRMVDTYYSLLVQNADLKNILSDSERDYEQISEVNIRLEEELDFTKKLYSIVSRENTKLTNSLKKFLSDLEEAGITGNRESKSNGSAI